MRCYPVQRSNELLSLYDLLRGVHTEGQSDTIEVSAFVSREMHKKMVQDGESWKKVPELQSVTRGEYETDADCEYDWEWDGKKKRKKVRVEWGE